MEFRPIVHRHVIHYAFERYHQSLSRQLEMLFNPISHSANFLWPSAHWRHSLCLASPPPPHYAHYAAQFINATGNDIGISICPPGIRNHMCRTRKLLLRAWHTPFFGFKRHHHLQMPAIQKGIKRTFLSKRANKGSAIFNKGAFWIVG